MSETLLIYSNRVIPSINSLLDLGEDDFEFKDIWIDGTAYLDAIEMHGDIEMSDNDIISMGRINGAANDTFIDMATIGVMLIQGGGGGTPFSTPPIDVSGSVFFDSDIGLDTDKKIQFRDTALYINSSADGYLDFVADYAFQFTSTADTDITINFSGTTNSGILQWMEDEDYFRLHDDLFLDDQQKLFLRDTDIFIHSPNDGELLLRADTQITLNAPINANSHSFITTGTLSAHGYSVNVVEATEDYFPEIDDDVIIMNPTGVGRFVYLPSATVRNGKVYVIKAQDFQSGETVTLSTSSGETIDGESTYPVNSDYGTVTIVSDGNNWFTI